MKDESKNTFFLPHESNISKDFAHICDVVPLYLNSDLLYLPAGTATVGSFSIKP